MWNLDLLLTIKFNSIALLFQFNYNIYFQFSYICFYKLFIKILFDLTSNILHTYICLIIIKFYININVWKMHILSIHFIETTPINIIKELQFNDIVILKSANISRYFLVTNLYLIFAQIFKVFSKIKATYCVY